MNGKTMFTEPQKRAVIPIHDLSKNGRADLSFQRDSRGRTYLAQQYVEYPFHITKPFYLDSEWPDLATLYIASASGGLVQGDKTSLHVKTGGKAAVHVTTSAATKVHSMIEGRARQSITLEVEAGGYLEYLPDPAVLFPRSRLQSSITVTIGKGACAVVGDSIFAHNPNGNKIPSFDFYRSDCSLYQMNGELLAIDRIRIENGESLFGLPGITGGRFAQGTVYLVCEDRPFDEMTDGLRRAMVSVPDVYWGVSILPNDCGIWLRVLAEDGHALRNALTTAWTSCRKLAVGRTMSIRPK